MESQDDDLDNQLPNGHLQQSLFKFSDFFVDQDSVDKMVENAFSEDKLGQVHVIIQSFWATNGDLVSHSELLIKPPQDSFSDLREWDCQECLRELLKFSQS